MSKSRQIANVPNRLSVADRTELLTKTGTREGEVILQRDIGLLYAWTDTQGTDNSGTILNVSTGSWLAQYSGAVNVKWFGAVGDGVADDTNAFVISIDSINGDINSGTGGSLFIPSGEYSLNSLSFTNIKNISILGEGASSRLNFNRATGDGLKFGYGVDGGSMQITIENIAIGDDRATTLVTEAFVFESGRGGQSPPQTSGLFALRDITFFGLKNILCTALVLRDVSHIEMSNVHQPYEFKAGLGLLIETVEDINTGVYNFSSSGFRGAATAMRINAGTQLIDSMTFNGCFFANHVNADAVEVVEIVGTKIINSVMFNACHFEARHNSKLGAIKVGGTIGALMVSGCHISCGTGSDQNLYGFLFDGAILRGCSFTDNEFLRIDGSGFMFRFENNCSTEVASQTAIMRNLAEITSPKLLQIESGGSEDAIWNGLQFAPMEYVRNYTAVNNTVQVITPPKTEGIITIMCNNFGQFSGTVMYRAEPSGAYAIIQGGGADFEATTGVLDGTTGTTNKLTISAAIDGKLYIENRIGFSNLYSIKFNGFVDSGL